MPLFRPLLSRLSALFSRRKLDREMAEEMQIHLAMETERNRAAGMSADEARYAALRQFGGVDQLRERERYTRGWVWLEQLWKDFLLAGRSLRKSPGFSCVAIVTLAAGIAATASLVSVVKGLLLDPLPYPDPGQVVSVWRKEIGALIDFMPLTTQDYFDLQDRATSLAGFGVFSPRRYNLGGDRPEGIEGALCSAGLFRTLGVQPLHGRWFAPEDEHGDATAVVILSYPLWKQHFNSDPAVVGRTIRLDGRDHTIVGVMPEGFALLSLWTRDRPLGLWTLLALRRGDSSGYWLGAIARLKPGVTAGQAGGELKTIARELAQADPTRDAHKTFFASPLSVELGGIPALRISVLLGAGWALLVLASKNVAGMLLARGLGRQPEMAVRIALGARRGHILRLVIMESLLLSVLASAAGCLLTLWCISGLAGLLPPEVMPRNGFGFDAGLLGCVAVLTLLSTQMAGVAPALLASRTDVVGSLKEGGANSSQARHTQRKLRNLVVSQIATALLLVAVALQLSEGYRQMLIDSRTLASDNVLTASIVVKGPAYAEEASRVNFWRRLLDRCSTLPGVREAAVATKLPYDGGISLTVLPDDKAFDPTESYSWAEESCVSPGFFPAIGARLLQGRLLAREDEANPRNAVVINQTMARQYWPGQNPIGRHIRPAQEGKAWTAEVVGVIEDIRQFADRPVKPEMYFPYAAAPGAEAFLVIRMPAGVSAPVEMIRNELARIDSDVALAGVRTLGKLIRTQSRVFSVISSMAAAITFAVLGLAAVGLYGTLSFHFAQRRRDIGIRLAMGANQRDILRLVFKQAMVWVAIGLAAGALGAWGLSSVLQRMFPGASPFNPTGVSVGAAVVFATALLAAWLPAKRAMQVNPVDALRSE